MDTFFGALQRKYPGCRPGPAKLMLRFLRNQKSNFKTSGTRPRPAPCFLSKPTKSKQKRAPLRGAWRDGNRKLTPGARCMAWMVSLGSPSVGCWQGATRGVVSCERASRSSWLKSKTKSHAKRACRCSRGISAGAGDGCAASCALHLRRQMKPYADAPLGLSRQGASSQAPSRQT